ncbi:hypothetical protein OIV83_004652 [Microbotryomycetes sp. JL201]|nr:hypothetical protein OIV83_004652 [Microbotryomycetes sp. JL201]
MTRWTITPDHLPPSSGERDSRFGHVMNDAKGGPQAGPGWTLYQILKKFERDNSGEPFWYAHLHTDSHFAKGQLLQVLNSLNGVEHYFNRNLEAPGPGWQDEPVERAFGHDPYILDKDRRGGLWTRRQRERYT